MLPGLVLRNPPLMQTLTRSETDRVIAGVAGGIAQRLGVNSTLVRLAWVLSVFFGGLGVVVYLILWSCCPRAARPPPRVESPRSATRAVRSPPQSSSGSDATSGRRHDGDFARSHGLG